MSCAPLVARLPPSQGSTSSKPPAKGQSPLDSPFNPLHKVLENFRERQGAAKKMIAQHC